MKADNVKDPTNSSLTSPQISSILRKQEISTLKRERLIALCSAFLVTVLCIVVYLINKDIHIFSSLLLYPSYRAADFYFGKSKPSED